MFAEIEESEIKITSCQTIVSFTITKRFFGHRSDMITHENIFRPGILGFQFIDVLPVTLYYRRLNFHCDDIGLNLSEALIKLFLRIQLSNRIIPVNFISR